MNRPSDHPSDPVAAHIVRGATGLQPLHRPARYLKGAVYEAECEAARVREEADRQRAELEHVRRDAEAEGRAAGLAEAGSLLQSLRAHHRQLIRQFEAAALATATALLELLLDTDERLHDEAVARLAASLLSRARLEPGLVLRVPASSAAAFGNLQGGLDGLVADPAGVTVIPDASLPAGSLRIETVHGDRRCSLRAHLRHLRREARRLAAGDAHD